MWSRPSTLLLIATLAFPGAAAGADAALPPFPEQYLWECRDTAVPIDVDDFLGDPDRYAGNCVRASGFVFNGLFYKDVASFYEDQRQENAVVIFAPNLQGDKRPWTNRVRIEIIGRAGVCSEMIRRLSEANERGAAVVLAEVGAPIEDAEMLGLRCHYQTAAAAISLYSWTVTEVLPNRLSYMTARPEPYRLPPEFSNSELGYDWAVAFDLRKLDEEEICRGNLDGFEMRGILQHNNPHVTQVVRIEQVNSAEVIGVSKLLMIVDQTGDLLPTRRVFAEKLVAMEELDRLRTAVDEANFFTRTDDTEILITGDGAGTWLLEVCDEGRYQLIDRYIFRLDSMQTDPLWQLFEMMAEIAGAEPLSIPPLQEP